MISHKKSFALKMLQIALTLSLLHYDYNYRRNNWDDRLDVRDSNGWELEILRAVPVVEYPYANRKTMIPLIEDLVAFDRVYSVDNRQNVTAYVLNIPNESSHQTVALQQVQNSSQIVENDSALSRRAALNATTYSANSTNDTAASDSEDTHAFSQLSIYPDDERSVMEQNLSDLKDYDDLPSGSAYFDFLIKDEFPSNNTTISLNAFQPTISSLDGHTNSTNFLSDQLQTNETKIELPTTEIKNEETASSTTEPVFANTIDSIKQEHQNSDDNGQEFKVDVTPFLDEARAIPEESEIVEVLWKQDVDLGYSLTQEQLLAASEINENIDNTLTQLEQLQTQEDIEKLKALEKLKEHKENDIKFPDDDDSITGWDGIPFTIDNETGEYIRLPLDELLNDVLQLAELESENKKIDDNLALTSKAAEENNKKVNAKDDKKDDESCVRDKEKIEKCSSSKLSEISNDSDLPQSDFEVGSLPSPLFDLDDEAKEELAHFDIMLQSAAPSLHHHSQRPTSTSVQNYAAVGGANSAFHRQPSGFHHGHHQGRMPISRTVSMEQRLQDIASLFNPIPNMGVVSGVSDMPPYPHYPTHYSYQSSTGISQPPQHAQYPPLPPHHPHHSHHGMIHSNSALGELIQSQPPHYGHNLGTAVSTSMQLTNGNHNSDLSTSAAMNGNNVLPYKLEHDVIYYPNASSDMNHTTDGFFNSILNDEDLHLMDMHVNDNFYRMVDACNTTSNNSTIMGASSGIGCTDINNSSAAANSISISCQEGASATGMSSEIGVASAQCNGDRLDASSDSAVSSMGSERVPSLSDGEWGEGSDSAQDFHHNKYVGPYDYSYNHNRINDSGRQLPVAQKKHQMYGKRYSINEQAVPLGNVTERIVPESFTSSLNDAALPIKYEYDTYPKNESNVTNEETGVRSELIKSHQIYGSKYSGSANLIAPYSLDFSLRSQRSINDAVQHNHSYTLPQESGSLPRPQLRDKKISSCTKSGKSVCIDEEHLTRDEKRARALNIPILVSDIINLPMDEFNERLSKYDLTENQLSLIRDIRRRGKNKVAAQNCRKRKLDQIVTLEDEVKKVRRRKEELSQERESLGIERKRISNKFAQLHKHIFQFLRDGKGNPCSPSEYSLQQAADGSIYLLPRDGSSKIENINNTAGGSNINSIAAPNDSNVAEASGLQQNHHVSSIHQHGHQHHQMRQQHHILPQQHSSHARASGPTYTNGLQHPSNRKD